MQFHEVSTSLDHIAWVDRASVVRVMATATLAEIATFPMNWSMGGRRLCLLAGSKPVLIGAHWQDGLAGYGIEGAKLWHERRNLTQIQHVRALDAERPTVALAREGKPGTTLNPMNGKALFALKGAARIHPVGPGSFVWASKKRWHLAACTDWQALRAKPLISKSLSGALAGAAMLGPVVVLCLRSSVEGYNANTGKRLWTLEIPDSHIAQGIANRPAGGVWVWASPRSGVHEIRLTVVDSAGEIHERQEIGNRRALSLIPGTDLAACATGEVFSLTTNETVARLSG